MGAVNLSTTSLLMSAMHTLSDVPTAIPGGELKCDKVTGLTVSGVGVLSSAIADSVWGGKLAQVSPVVMGAMTSHDR